MKAILKNGATVIEGSAKELAEYVYIFGKMAKENEVSNINWNTLLKGSFSEKEN